MHNGNFLPTNWNRSLLTDFFGDFDALFSTAPALKRDSLLNWNRFGACDIEETDKAYVLQLDMPGLQKEDIKIEVLGNRLVIRAEKKANAESKDKNLHLRERSVGSFERSFALGNTADYNGIEAHYEQGVLRLEIPKKEQAKQKTIEVK